MKIIDKLLRFSFFCVVMLSINYSVVHAYGECCSGAEVGGCGGIDSSCPVGYLCVEDVGYVCEGMGGVCYSNADCPTGEELEEAIESADPLKKYNCYQSQAGKTGSAGGCPTGYTCTYVGDGTYSCIPSQGGSATKLPDYKGPKITNIVQVLAPITKILYYAGLIIGIGFIIYSGYVLMTSEGNPDRVRDGKEQLTAAILGTMFILLSAAILRVIINSFLGLYINV